MGIGSVQSGSRSAHGRIAKVVRRALARMRPKRKKRRNKRATKRRRRKKKSLTKRRKKKRKRVTKKKRKRRKGVTRRRKRKRKKLTKKKKRRKKHPLLQQHASLGVLGSLQSGSRSAHGRIAKVVRSALARLRPPPSQRLQSLQHSLQHPLLYPLLQQHASLGALGSVQSGSRSAHGRIAKVVRS